MNASLSDVLRRAKSPLGATLLVAAITLVQLRFTQRAEFANAAAKKG